MVACGQCFFLGVKIKSGREADFLPFFEFSHGQKKIFTPTFFGFFDFFHARLFFFTPTFFVFFRFLHGQKNQFHGHFSDILHGQKV